RVRQSGYSRIGTDIELQKIIRQGAPAWNAWREKNWETDGRARRPSMRGANFSSLDLQEINLFDANLQFANFSGSNLTNANLEAIDLANANLSQAIIVDS